MSDMEDVTRLVQAFNLLLTMQRDRNVAALEKQLELVKNESNEKRFKRMGIEWVPGMYEFQRAAVAAIACHEECDSPLLMRLDKITRLEVRWGEGLGKPGTVRLDVSQSAPFPSFECYVSSERFIEAWIGSEL